MNLKKDQPINKEYDYKYYKVNRTILISITRIGKNFRQTAATIKYRMFYKID